MAQIRHAARTRDMARQDSGRGFRQSANSRGRTGRKSLDSRRQRRSVDLKDGTLASAGFVNPTAIAVDEIEAIFVADGNAIRTIGRRISLSSRRSPTTGVVSPTDHRSLSRFNRPSGLAFDPDGDLLIADSDNRRSDGLGRPAGHEISTEQKEKLAIYARRISGLQPARWPL